MFHRLQQSLRRWLGIDKDIKFLVGRIATQGLHIEDHRVRIRALEDCPKESQGSGSDHVFAPATTWALPEGIEASIQSRFGWNPVGAHLTRTAMLRHLRAGGDPVEAQRALDGAGEVIE
jgi:hypothetical protein